MESIYNKLNDIVKLHEKGFFLLYLGKTQGRWYFKQDPQLIDIRRVDDIVCEYLVNQNLIVPEIDNFEFLFQNALGLMNFRVFKVNKDKLKEYLNGCK